MQKKLAGLIGCLLILGVYRVYGQSSTLHYGLQSNLLLSSDNSTLPFWFYSKQDGRVDRYSNNFLTDFYSVFTKTPVNSRFRYETGFNLSSRLSDNSSLFFSQLYGKLGYGFLNISVGRFYNPIGLGVDNLAMGSMMVSRNATPIPKIEISTNGFTNVPFTHGYFQFKAMMAHGWLENNRYVKNSYLHQKYFYLKTHYKFFEGYGGIVHNVIWGGTSPRFGHLPSSFNDFIRVLTGSAASPNSDAPRGEITNAIGNTVAAYDFGMRLTFPGFKIKASRLFYLEDTVESRFRSPWDGTWEAVLTLDNNKWLSKILWQFLSTKRQGSLFDAKHNEPYGTDSYYNHFIYKDGWTYQGMVIGNPLLLNEPNSNFKGQRAITNNIIVAQHVGIKGQVTNRLGYQALFTYSRNYGTSSDQYPKQNGEYIPLSDIRVDEFSTYLQTEYLISPENNLKLTTGVAFDTGQLYNERFGLQVGIKWMGLRRL